MQMNNLKRFLIGVLLLGSLHLSAQYLPFQGKLFDQNDQPLSGTYNFIFSISDGGVFWFETHTNVEVYQGLYAVVLGARETELPSTLFRTSATHTLRIQVNGETIDNITLYRPIPVDGNPPGTILSFGGPNIPPGYLPCDGQVVSKEDYPELFAAIATSWGGDGNPNFHLPDLRGRFMRGWDNGAGNDPDSGGRSALHLNGSAGDAIGSYQDDEFGRHKHDAKFKVGAEPTTGGSRSSEHAAGGHGAITDTWRAVHHIEVV